MNDDKYDVLKVLPIASWEWPRPVVYVPLPQALPYADDVFPTFIEIARTGVPFMHLPYGFADRMRNFAAEELLESDYTHLIMLDSDHTHPLDIVQRLCRMVIDDPIRGIVGGMNYKRCEPYSPCAYVDMPDGVYRVHEWEGGEPFEVAAIGFGAVMISKEVFATVERPWFWHDFGGAKDNPDFVYPGHDIAFCKRAREAGVSIWVDPTLCSPHMTASKVTERTYRTFCAMKEATNEH